MNDRISILLGFLGMDYSDPLLKSYTKSHLSSDTARNEHLITYDIIRQHLEPGSVLDWGAGVGWNSELMKNDGWSVNSCETYDCEFIKGVDFTKLNHVWQLPFQDGQFDNVLSSGTLEHVAQESLSMSELYRVIRPDGRLIIAYLPQKYSMLEAWLRLTKGTVHQRRYTLSGVRSLLLSHGFQPIKHGWHHALPLRFTSRLSSFLFRFWERIPVMRVLTQNLWIVAIRTPNGIGSIQNVHRPRLPGIKSNYGNG